MLTPSTELKTRSGCPALKSVKDVHPDFDYKSRATRPTILRTTVGLFGSFSPIRVILH